MLAGAKIVFIDTTVDGFKLTPDKLEAALSKHPHAKALILNYPTNPTGVTYTREELKALVAPIRNRPMLVISDEIYSELSYDHTHVSLGEILSEQTILLTGVSKSHTMTVYRIGFAAGPTNIIQRIATISQFTVTSATTIAQDAATEALTAGWGALGDFKYRNLGNNNYEILGYSTFDGEYSTTSFNHNKPFTLKIHFNNYNSFTMNNIRGLIDPYDSDVSGNADNNNNTYYRGDIR